MKLDTIIKQLAYKWKMGYTLNRLFNELKDMLGIAKSPWVFSEFVKLNKGNKKFMDEFNSSCFVDNVIPNIAQN